MILMAKIMRKNNFKIQMLVGKQLENLCQLSNKYDFRLNFFSCSPLQAGENFKKKLKLGQNCPISNTVPSPLDVNACNLPDIGRCTNLRQKSHVTMMDLQGSYSNHKFNDGDSFFEVIDLPIE